MREGNEEENEWMERFRQMIDQRMMFISLHPMTLEEERQQLGQKFNLEGLPPVQSQLGIHVWGIRTEARRFHGRNRTDNHRVIRASIARGISREFGAR